MDAYSRIPDFSGNQSKFVKNFGKKHHFYLFRQIIFSNRIKILLCFFVVSTILSSTTFFSLKKTQEIAFSFEKDFVFQEKKAVLNNNTLMPISDPFNPEPKIVKKITVIVTAYSSTPWETWGDPFITAAGTRVRDGIIANNLFPFGTKIRMPEIYGNKVFIVEDRMHSRKGNYHFDIWFPSYYEAKEFGAKKTYIEVLES